MPDIEWAFRWRHYGVYSASEAMGQQHYEPLEYFGGEVAFQDLVERDRKKKHLCNANDVNLIYVRFDEDVGLRAKEIVDEVLAVKGRAVILWQLSPPITPLVHDLFRPSRRRALASHETRQMLDRSRRRPALAAAACIAFGALL